MTLIQHCKKSVFLLALSLISLTAMAQDSTKFYIFSGIGVINGLGTFGKSVKPSLAFNSGIELKLRKNVFCQLSVDFNALTYNQQHIENNSPYLFQNTNSTLLVVGLNIGYQFAKPNTRLSGFAYVGSGYLNIGEPRVTLNSANTIVQSVSNTSNIFGRGGFRIGYKTNSAFFQTIYVDTTYWASPAVAQRGNVKGISILIGTRITM
jgi:hypothetical protein